MNPANQFGLDIFWFVTTGLSIGRISGKAVLNCSARPQFIDALIATILLHAENEMDLKY